MRVIHIVVLVEKASQGAWLFDFLRVHLISLSLSLPLSNEPEASQKSLASHCWSFLSDFFLSKCPPLLLFFSLRCFSRFMQHNDTGWRAVAGQNQN